MARLTRSTHLRVAVLTLFACGTACSLLLQANPVPCSTDADCAKLTGSRCDVSQHQCVSGVADAIDGSSGLDTSTTTPDSATPPVDASLPDGSASDSGTIADTGAGDDVDAADAGRTHPDWAAVSSYLQILYEPTQSMVRRTPSSTEFWATNDNILAARAFTYLPTPVPTMSQSILTRLAALKTCACGDNFGHTADINHLVDPVVHKGAQIPLVPNGACFGEPSEIASCNAGFDAGGAIVCSAASIRTEDHADLGWGPDSCHPTACGGTKYGNWNDPGQGAGFADLIALEILNYRNRGMDPTPLWTNLSSKWDGRGMRDSVTAGDSTYQTYKLALFKLAGRVLGKTTPPAVDETLAAAQGGNGGIRTSYALDGTFSLDQSGSAEATSYVVLAYLKPLSDF